VVICKKLLLCDHSNCDRVNTQRLIDVILIKSDPIINQPTIRDQKIIRSLSKKYAIIVLGWNRGKGLSKKERSDIIPWNFKLFKLNAPFGAPSLLPYLPIFWSWVFLKLAWYRPKIIHACDLEAMPPCYLYKKIFGRKLIFDVFDRHAMAYIPRKNMFYRKLYSFTNSLEERLAEGADVLISVSDELINTFQRKPKNCIPILNCAEDHSVHKALGFEKEDKFTIAFTGHIRRNRGLEPLVAAIKELKAVNLVVTGRVEDKELLNEIQSISNVKYLGFLEHTQVLTIESSSDAMVALYNLDAYAQNRYVLGNKLFEAMMCGIPIITNVATEIVTETQCGIVVNYKVDQIRDAIVSLRDDPHLRKRLGINGRKAFLQKYNWSVMERELFKIYENLIGNSQRL
jgi:glycosyltransferase involved in cell wall biosynthesis